MNISRLFTDNVRLLHRTFANMAASDPIKNLTPEQYLRLRWKHRDRFNFYRQGRGWDARQRAQADYGGLQNKVFPKVPSGNTGLPAPSEPLDVALYELRRSENRDYELLRPEDMNGMAEWERQRITRIQGAIQILRDGFGISKIYRYNSCVGAGGCGVTALVDQYDNDNNHEALCVVKVNTSSVFSAVREGMLTDVSYLDEQPCIFHNCDAYISIYTYRFIGRRDT